MRTLTLTSPYMRGDAVLTIQKRLNLRTDGIYGPATAGAVKSWKWRTGFHTKFVNTNCTASDFAYLTGKLERTYLMKVRSKRRAKSAAAGIGEQDRAAKIMRAWAADGLVEQPANSNVVPRLRTIGREQGVKSYYSTMGYPWCAYSVMLAALNAGSETAKRGLIDGAFNPLYVPEIESLARQGKFGMRIVGWSNARAGDFVTFNWDGGVPDHIGMLLSVGVGDAMTVEGNTSPSNAGSQSNGGGVYVRNRDRSAIQAIIRWS
jgi:hypothetical protein